jgi:hypothetical protein
MSGIAEPPVAPPAAAPAAPAAPTPPPTGRSALPESASLKPAAPSTDELFSKFEAAKKAEAVPASGGAEPAPQPAPAPPAPAAPAPKDDVASQLTRDFLPEGAKPTEKPATAAPAASANPEDAVTLDKSYTPKAHESFAQVKAITKDLRGQLQKANDELTAAKAEVEKVRSGAVVVDSPEIAALRAEHEAMSKRLMVLDLQAHPRFQQEFDAPRNASLAAASELLPGANVAGLLALPRAEFGKAVSEAAKNLSPFDQTDFATHMRNAYQLKQKGDAAIGKAGEISQALKTQQLNGYKTAFDGTWGKTLGSLTGVRELTVPASATPEQLAEVESFNGGFRAIRAEAEKIALGTNDPEGISRASIKAAAYEWQTKHVLPLMSKTIKAKEARIAELEGLLSGIRARNPNAQIRGQEINGGGVDPSKMNHHDAAEYFANQMRNPT